MQAIILATKLQKVYIDLLFSKKNPLLSSRENHLFKPRVGKANLFLVISTNYKLAEQSYNMAAKRWDTLTSINLSEGEIYTVTQWKNVWFVFNLKREIFCYDMHSLSNGCRTTIKTPTRRFGYAVLIYKNCMYVLGGKEDHTMAHSNLIEKQVYFNIYMNEQNTVKFFFKFRYDLLKRIWIPYAPLSHGIPNPIAVSVYDKIICIDADNSTIGEYIDLSTGYRGPFEVQRGRHPINQIVFHDGELYVAYCDHIDKYNFQNDMWMTVSVTFTNFHSKNLMLFSMGICEIVNNLIFNFVYARDRHSNSNTAKIFCFMAFHKTVNREHYTKIICLFLHRFLAMSLVMFRTTSIQMK